ncbi:MAG: TIGR00282 family metallophosphoesterase [Candidatus Omnitrophica bacterium]|nr:TIGR00282 family metallophosphoesterase [Candidatus Omnitrophota bacterium]MBU0879007.1 TIGR00282 family metallophosphoesterase [Candidatus Omnitrophota bacterium]MBU1134406.1 TIGR00282 family metallophosphoesterase [Candidatus Omnitrophota bacterium]MBU1367509.1 TIGR00282 family metallophosphoesterase [Candidatus Omnitrophota bacterium]MBU1809911.1 TIGR00282 family metallophosphoesterase [Candidatus Omnitrophota bacterium]
MRILFAGDVVGRPARAFLKEALPQIKESLNVDFVIVNGENAAGGSSITLATARDLFSCGVDVITTGDHIFKKKEAKEVLEKEDAIRPLNYGGKAFGRGWLIKEKGGKKIGVINLLGRVFMQPIDCPFKAVRDVLEEIKKETKAIIVDVHAEATSEKAAMGHFLTGKVSAVVGTHTHVPTADERILDDFTAYITDVGMTGSFDSILGREKHQIIERFLTNMPMRFNLAQNDIRMQAVVIEIEEATGRALSIERVERRKEAETGLVGGKL